MLVVTGQTVSVLFSVWLFRWKRLEKKVEKLPEEIHADMARLTSDLVKVREDVARIKGRMNFKAWKEGS